MNNLQYQCVMYIYMYDLYNYIYTLCTAMHALEHYICLCTIKHGVYSTVIFIQTKKSTVVLYIQYSIFIQGTLGHHCPMQH